MTPEAYTAVSATPSEASQPFRRPVAGRKPGPRDQIRDHGQAHLEGGPADDASHRERVSSSLTAAKPELISGSAVAAANTVAPKMTPLIPARPASAWPLSSSAAPAISVTPHAAARARTVDPGRRLSR